MTTQEAIYKLENYDELEGKYNEALARIDEYKRERKEIADKALKALAEREQSGADHIALTEIANMMVANPAFSDDNLEVGKVGNIVKDKRNGEIGIYVGMGPDGFDYILVLHYDDQIFDARLIVSTDNWIKTGKYYPQIAEILAELRGENDEIAD